MNDSFSADICWPMISVVVCVFNGESTIELCLRELANVDYPNFEALVIDDGSTDSTKALILENLKLRPAFRLIELAKNEGLSVARNVGLREAKGEIVAYLDSDAYPDKMWLKQLANLFLKSKYIAIGGPNLNPPNSGLIADCVDQAPGSPTCVLTSPTDADHIAGCNLAIRKAFLSAMGGFDPIYRAAGDDVDICWRIQKFGGTLGYVEEAVVWHCRRNTVKGYLKQQRGYGRAEAILSRHWPEKFNRMGHVTWGSVVYGKRLYGPIVYADGTKLWSQLPQMPEWNLLLIGLLTLGSLGFIWSPLFLFIGLFAIGLGLSLTYAFIKSWQARFSGNVTHTLRCRALLIFLYLAQPVARLYGRMEFGLTPWSAYNLKENVK